MMPYPFFFHIKSFHLNTGKFLRYEDLSYIVLTKSLIFHVRMQVLFSNNLIRILTNKIGAFTENKKYVLINMHAYIYTWYIYMYICV
jgi:hypothetical protein